MRRSGRGVGLKGCDVMAALLGDHMTVEPVPRGILLLPKRPAELLSLGRVGLSEVHVLTSPVVPACLCVRLCVRVDVPAGAGMKPWIWVGTVPVAAPQRAEDHGAAGHRAAVFDFQVDSIVVDLQCSCTNTRKDETDRLFMAAW